MDNISIEDKVKIASGFLLSSPPGEVNDVFNGNWNCALPVLLGLKAYILLLFRCSYFGEQ